MKTIKILFARVVNSLEQYYADKASEYIKTRGWS
jgi:hypothetical protein